MNCKHVEELLPLYVGRDLEEKRAQRVTAHVQSCTPCAHSVEEYRQAQRLLQLFEPPPFSEGVYAGIRSRVLREIAQESTSLTPPQQFAQMVLQPRIRWAASFALLLAVCVGAFYFLTQPSSGRLPEQQVTAGGKALDSTGRDIQSGAGPHVNGNAGPPSSSSNDGAGHSTRGAGGRRRRNFGRKLPAMGTTKDETSMIAKVLPKNNNPAEPDASSAPALATSEKTLRMEIQTSDRNVRIIWFAPQRTKEDSSESSKGL